MFSKIEERKKLLEPQVLRIADDDDLLENDLEVDDSVDDDNGYAKQSDEFQEGLLNTVFILSLLSRCRTESFKETTMSPSHRRNFGFDESFPTDEQRWRSSAMSTNSPEKSESRLTTGDTGKINCSSSRKHSFILRASFITRELFFELANISLAHTQFSMIPHRRCRTQANILRNFTLDHLLPLIRSFYGIKPKGAVHTRRHSSLHIPS